MMKTVLLACLAICIMPVTSGRLSAQSTPVLDTLQADGYLRIVAPTLKNLFALAQMEQAQFESTLPSYGYTINTGEAKGTYKITSFQATYNIYKSKYEVEFYFSTMAGTLDALRADVKKKFPNVKISVDGADVEYYDFEEKTAAGHYIYQLNINAANGTAVFVSLTSFSL